MYRAIQNRLNPLLSILDYAQIPLKIFIEFLDLNNDFKHFIHVSKVLEQGVEGSGSLSDTQIYFNFKLGLFPTVLPL